MYANCSSFVLLLIMLQTIFLSFSGSLLIVGLKFTQQFQNLPILILWKKLAIFLHCASVQYIDLTNFRQFDDYNIRKTPISKGDVIPCLPDQKVSYLLQRQQQACHRHRESPRSTPSPSGSRGCFNQGQPLK